MTGDLAQAWQHLRLADPGLPPHNWRRRSSSPSRGQPSRLGRIDILRSRVARPHPYPGVPNVVPGTAGQSRLRDESSGAPGLPRPCEQPSGTGSLPAPRSLRPRNALSDVTAARSQIDDGDSPARVRSGSLTRVGSESRAGRAGSSLDAHYYENRVPSSAPRASQAPLSGRYTFTKISRSRRSRPSRPSAS